MNAFPFVLQSFWLSLGVLSATALIVIAVVRLLQHQCFSNSFKTFWLSLGVLSATALIVIAGVHLLQN